MNQNLQMELRIRTANSLYELDGEEKQILIGLAEPEELESREKAVDRYIQKFKQNGTLFLI